MSQQSRKLAVPSTGQRGAALLLALVGSTASAAFSQDAGPNPAKAAVGSSLFRAYCASCHGTSGKGNGDIAQYLKLPPADLTAIAKRNGGIFDFQKIVTFIDGRQRVRGHGGEMPVWGDALQIAAGGATESEAQRKIESLAHYVWSLQQK